MKIDWMTAAAVYFAAVNVAAFLLMAADKRRAGTGRRRIPESRLFAAALLGGGAGGWAGMRVWRHKTRHARFVWGMPVLAVLDIAGMAWLIVQQPHWVDYVR